MSRPQYERGYELRPGRYEYGHRESLASEPDHRITLPPPRDMVAGVPTRGHQQPDYQQHYNYPSPSAPQAAQPYRDSSSYTTMPRVQSPESSTHHGRPTHYRAAHYDHSAHDDRPTHQERSARYYDPAHDDRLAHYDHSAQQDSSIHHDRSAYQDRSTHQDHSAHYYDPAHDERLAHYDHSAQKDGSVHHDRSAYQDRSTHQDRPARYDHPAHQDRVAHYDYSAHHERSNHHDHSAPHDPSFRGPQPEYKYPTMYPHPNSHQAVENRPAERRMEPSDVHNPSYPSDVHNPSYPSDIHNPPYSSPSHPVIDQSTPRRVETFRQGASDQSNASAMSQRQSTFQARPAAVTFGPTSEIPNRIAPVLNLLGPGRADDVAGIRFRISVRQQPEAARACGSGERDRRTIDPPPIVQLHVDGPNLSHEDKKKYLSWDGYVCHCWIWDQYGTAEASIMPAEYHYQRRLTGSQVAAPFFGKDQKRVEGCFFTFSDLSVRTLGTYKLKFNMIMMDVTNPGQSRHFPNLCEVISRPFTVYTAKDFPGISESSGLVRALRAQGCIISIKKGNEKKRRTGRRCDEDDDSSDD